MLLCQAYLSVVNLESRSGQDTGLDLAQGLADLVHGLVHYHDGGTRGPFQPAMLAVSAAQHAVYQAPAASASTHSLVVCVSGNVSSPCNVSKHLFTCCVCVVRLCEPLHHQGKHSFVHSVTGICVTRKCTDIWGDAEYVCG